MNRSLFIRLHKTNELNPNTFSPNIITIIKRPSLRVRKLGRYGYFDLMKVVPSAAGAWDLPTKATSTITVIRYGARVNQ